MLALARADPFEGLNRAGTHAENQREGMVLTGNGNIVLGVGTDPVAALDTPYRGLVASGWHLTAIWTKLMVSYMERFASGVRDGRRNGAGMGIENMVWYRPVRPGHIITFTYDIVEKPDRIVRDKCGIIRSRNEAFNQYNQLVMSFMIDILAERKP